MLKFIKMFMLGIFLLPNMSWAEANWNVSFFLNSNYKLVFRGQTCMKNTGPNEITQNHSYTFTDSNNSFQDCDDQAKSISWDIVQKNNPSSPVGYFTLMHKRKRNPSIFDWNPPWVSYGIATQLSPGIVAEAKCGGSPGTLCTSDNMYEGYPSSVSIKYEG